MAPMSDLHIDKPERHVTFTYRNWKNETKQRKVIPGRIWFGSTPYHKDPQWLLDAWDLDKKAVRTFALKDITNWRPTHDQEATA